jgi:phosphoribosylaminoimidazole-succinocarboxamide synthase
MEKVAQMYEGKAKKVYSTENEDYCIISYKDDATAFNGEKKGTISGKGVVNNKMSNYIMGLMEKEGIPTHFVEELNDREAVVRRVTIIPLEVIIRNIAAGSFSKRFGVPEGTQLLRPTLEFCYKDDALGDPMANEYHIVACGWATQEDLDTITDYTFKINEFLKDFFKKVNVDLVDFKIEFGKTRDGKIILADEISPDTCRLWDSTTHEKLDKDRFRRDLGNVEGAYQEMMNRIFGDR